ncbi:hypothetical protein EVAR_86143_1 [Eumeta japonica]|uniref:E3 ubiquitin-protein ligase APD1-4 middle domain-containing protein n=1 Tax=Eumeta variegata TaxID=151549 RepID=A0A4C1V1B7_EUMVA|nr:hypothetical protein EVAR_86143_1 [Eumeta japonica]
MYPMGMTDMRLIDSKISTTWCQRQVVKSNTTFNAFVMPGAPELSQELVPVSMTRQLELEDDMKEYWGFYLLQGSSVTVSACVRWPGASLIMIKGYRHLQNCAYIGDDSSEELDELLEANKLGLISNVSLVEKILQLKKEDGPANHPDTMKRHKGGVQFHDPSHGVSPSPDEPVPAAEVTDPKELREILERLHAIRQAAKDEALKHYHPPSHLMALPALHRHRDTNVDRDERRWLSFKDLDSNVTFQDNNITTTAKYKDVANLTDGKVMNKNEETIKVNNASDAGAPTTLKPVLNVNEISSKEKITKNEPNSLEVFEDVLKKLQALGERGHRVLNKLQNTMGVKIKSKNVDSTTESNLVKHTTITELLSSSQELDRMREVLIEAIDEERTRSQRKEKRRAAADAARAKRELMLGGADLEKAFNEDDEARDYAAEEGLEPDGYAEHHEKLNETTNLDMSNSEFWSSFSSSEEALLECDGLILNLPLTPHGGCDAGKSEADRLKAAQRNAVTYRVPANGYYFFIFNSENEVQTNYISVRFDLHKTRYDVARTALRECRNSTVRCDLPLDIFSAQKVVLEVPLRDNESLWNEQFLVISECEPRTSLYLACVVAVPVLIVVFAFQ